MWPKSAGLQILSPLTKRRREKASEFLPELCLRGVGGCIDGFSHAVIATTSSVGSVQAGPRETLLSRRGFDPSAPTRWDGQKSAEDSRSFARVRGAKQVQNAKKKI